MIIVSLVVALEFTVYIYNLAQGTFKFYYTQKHIV